MERGDDPFEFPVTRRIISDPVEVTNWLSSELGLTMAPFDEACEHARLEWSTHTVFDAPGDKGTRFWLTAVRRFRWSLSDVQWIVNNDGGLSRIIHPAGKIAIVIETGDENTGIVNPLRPPKTNSPKGTMIANAISANLLQSEIFDDLEARRLEQLAQISEVMRTYIFLVRIERGRVFRELSLPMGRSETNHIAEWELRVIFPPIGGGDAPPSDQMPLPEPGPDPIISITRRAS